MLHQLILKSLNGLFGIARVKSKTLLILLVSTLLTACGGGGSKNEALLEPGLDGVNPTISKLLAVNECNYTKSVGLDNTILFEIDGSESLMKPTITILGERVEVSSLSDWTGEVDVVGQHKEWSARYNVAGPKSVDDDLKSFIASFSNFLYADIEKGIEKISHSVSFKDLAEETGNDLPEGDAVSLLASAITAEYGVDISEQELQDNDFNYDKLLEKVLEKEIIFSEFQAGDKTVNVQLKEFIVSFSDSLSIEDISYDTSCADFGDANLATALAEEFGIQEIKSEKRQDENLMMNSSLVCFLKEFLRNSFQR